MADVEEAAALEEAREEEDEEERSEGWDDWNADEDDSEQTYLCLFCDLRFASSDCLFDHCNAEHFFDFHGIRKALGLDFYGSFKLINYVRAQVAENKCWSCGALFKCKNDLQKHLHTTVNFGNDLKFIWDDDGYLKPFMCEDALLHCLPSDEEGEEDHIAVIDREEMVRELMGTNDLSDICIDNGDLESVSFEVDSLVENGRNETRATKECVNADNDFQTVLTNCVAAKKDVGTSNPKRKDKQLRVSFSNVISREIKKVNEDYFGSYGSFGIHREMISDKVRTDAYRGAILNNPSLMNGATVLDIGCGTGILSLFAAQAGASRVIAVEASEKMAAVASQVVKDNRLLLVGRQNGDICHCSGVINVVHGMIEDLDTAIQLPPNSIDVLVSEWMGYCLLYESMLSSVIYARDLWLRPGGAILPDVATLFVAGFGKGATSISFWENVYGFDMSCIGKEVTEDAAKVPIVDVVDIRDIVTQAVLLKSFDLATMKQEEMDFTSSFELEQRIDSTNVATGVSLCYGVVLWFETAFTSRFCKEMPYVLSTSPYSGKTHWCQTIFTLNEPVAMATLKSGAGDPAAAVGTEKCPAARISSRISIARAAVHRSIDISLEITAICSDGRKRCWPVQIFNL